MKLGIILFLVFILFLTDSTIFAQSDSNLNILHVSFVNNAASSYEVEFEPNEKFLLEQSYSWIRDDTSRYNLISYSIDGDDFIPVSRQPRGTFSIDIPSDSSSIVFSSTVQYPVSIEGVQDYSFSPKSPTNDNWFDKNSEIMILDITSNDSGLFPHEIVDWDGPVIDYADNSVQILIDSPIHLTAYWDTDYSFLGFLVLLPIVGITVFFLKRNRDSSVSKTIPKSTHKTSKSDSDDYEDKIKQFLKQKSIEKLDLLISSEIISSDKGIRIKEKL